MPNNPDAGRRGGAVLSTDTKATPRPWLREDNCVYALEEVRGARGRIEQRNRIMVGVQGGPDTPREEVLATAALIVRAVNAHDALVEALRPFAHFAEQFAKNPIRGINDVVYAIHRGEIGAELRLSDCQRALAALALASEES